MKLFKTAIVALVLLFHLVVAPPLLAEPDKPNYQANPEYIEVTSALDQLLSSQDTKAKAKIGDLRLQKYILETAEDWGQCRNETGKTLAIYANKPPKVGFSQESSLYFLGSGKTTDDDWDCDGVYLPSGVKVAGLDLPEQLVVSTTPSTVSSKPQPAATITKPEQLGTPIALKIVDGTQLVIKTNPDTAAIELNIPPAQVFKTGEVNWSIPTLSQAEIDLQVPNASID